MTAIEDAYRRFSTERFRLPSEEQLTELEGPIAAVLRCYDYLPGLKPPKYP